ncbi:type II secretion system protein GspL [Thalassococcus profundi]|nr:type II secretion system protein GspL [Thalassococcus profundi]
MPQAAFAASDPVVDAAPAPVRPVPQALARDRLVASLGPAAADRIRIVPAEAVSLFRLDLPIRGSRQRLAALPFALEDRLAGPIDGLHFALCDGAGGPGVLAAVISRDALLAERDAADGQQLVPECLTLPVPAAAETGAMRWAVCREGDRALVRLSDGTGFAAQIGVLSHLWRHAGEPEVTSFGAALPSDMRWSDAEAGAEIPDAATLATDLRQGAFAPDRGLARPLRALAAVVALAALAHLGLAYADLRAQRALAEGLRIEAQRLLAERIPEATIYDDPRLLMASLARSGSSGTGGVLPVFETAADALLAAGRPVSVRSLSWSDRSGALTLQVEAARLEDIQRMEEALRGAGLSVTAGTATQAEGAAQAELVLRGGGDG